MKIKTFEATGVVLCYLVCMIEMPHLVWGKTIGIHHASNQIVVPELPEPDCYSPFMGWAQGGPIKEREGIATRRDSKGVWYAMLSTDLGDGEGARWSRFTFKNVPKTASTSRTCRFTGNTELIATMRCYVASKLDDEVEVPDELCGAPDPEQEGDDGTEDHDTEDRNPNRDGGAR